MNCRTQAFVSGASLLAALLGAATVGAAERPRHRAASAREGVIDPRADAALRRMSDYLGGLRTFRVEAITVDEMVTTDGQKVQAIKRSAVAVKRPGALSVERIGPAGRVAFSYDGRHFTIYGARDNVYATADAPPRLDDAIDVARDRLGIDAPGGDLIVANPYASLIDRVKVGRYVGLEPIDGVMAHHLAMTKDDVDWQIWIEDGPEPVPLRYVITSKDMPSQPEFTIDLRDWQPDVPLANSSFAFIPPPGARQVAWASVNQARKAQERKRAGQ